MCSACRDRHPLEQGQPGARGIYDCTSWRLGRRPVLGQQPTTVTIIRRDRPWPWLAGLGFKFSEACEPDLDSFMAPGQDHHSRAWSGVARQWESYKRGESAISLAQAVQHLKVRDYSGPWERGIVRYSLEP